jgi:hypothetical protein
MKNKFYIMKSINPIDNHQTNDFYMNTYARYQQVQCLKKAMLVWCGENERI